MPKPLPESTPQLNRLRAAAGLIPIIESGLSDGKLPVERVALMASFCEWATEIKPEDPAQIRLVEQVVAGLGRVRASLEITE